MTRKQKEIVVFRIPILNTEPVLQTANLIHESRLFIVEQENVEIKRPMYCLVKNRTNAEKFKYFETQDIDYNTTRRTE